MYDQDSVWDVKGHFNRAVVENDPADWIYENNKYILRLFVSLFITSLLICTEISTIG